jgi:DNA-directed RNA polymerase subunit M/transcription elongation factor TFIIS
MDDDSGNKEHQQPMFKTEGPTIVFDTGVVKSGQNYTVRKGSKWAERKEIKVGEVYQFTTTDGGYMGDATITHLITCQLKDVPKDVFAGEHDPDCKNPIVLYHTLQTIYGAESVTPTTFVTCVGFRMIGTP